MYVRQRDPTRLGSSCTSGGQEMKGNVPSGEQFVCSLLSGYLTEHFSSIGRVTVRFLYFHVVVPSRTEFYSSVSHAVGGRATSPRSPTPLFHALHGSPAFNSNECPSSKRPAQRQESSSSSPASSGVRCSNCDRVIV